MARIGARAKSLLERSPAGRWLSRVRERRSRVEAMDELFPTIPLHVTRSRVRELERAVGTIRLTPEEPARLLASVLVHEEPAVVADLVANVHRFVPGSTVVVHVNASFAAALGPGLGALRDALAPFGDRVVVNPEHRTTALHTGALVAAHISNFRYARDRADFTHVVFLASNQLFVRPGFERYAAAFHLGHDAVRIDWTNAERLWKRPMDVAADPVFLTHFKGYTDALCHKNACEGTFYHRAIFEEFAACFDPGFPYERVPYAAEEIWPVTFASAVEGQVRRGRQTCFIPWDRASLLVEVADIDRLRASDGHTYSVKRVERRRDDPVRAYVRDLTVPRPAA